MWGQKSRKCSIILQRIPVQETEDIAKIFQWYYTALYNLSCSEPSIGDPVKVADIQAYLQSSGLPSLSDEDLASLEDLFQQRS